MNHEFRMRFRTYDGQQRITLGVFESGLWRNIDGKSDRSAVQFGDIMNPIYCLFETVAPIIQLITTKSALDTTNQLVEINNLIRMVTKRKNAPDDKTPG